MHASTPRRGQYSPPPTFHDSFHAWADRRLACEASLPKSQAVRLL